MTNPFESPRAYDFITLDGKRIEVLVERDSGGREWVIEQQQSPGYAGAYTVVKQEKLSDVTYRFIMWLPAHFTTIRAWLDTFRAGQKKRPPRVYQLGDLMVEHNEIKQVVIRSISRLIQVARGRYSYEVTVDEYRKRRPIGGVAVPAKTATDTAIEQQEAINKSLQAQLTAQQKADAAGEDIGIFSGVGSLLKGL